MIDSKKVFVNSEVITKNIKIKPQDQICILVTNEHIDLAAENIPLDIIYEDENILVINKEPNFNVHPVPGVGGNSGTLVNAILYHCKNKLPCIKGTYRPGIVHRLDKNTSGVIMIAKRDQMMHYLADVIKSRGITKYYIAIVVGKIKEQTFKIESYIGRDPHRRKQMTTVEPINPKQAISYGEVLGYVSDKYTVLKVQIETGRTHQIRVHLASIGFPVLGDPVYGYAKPNKEALSVYGLQRQALHAYQLIFKLYGKEVCFHAELKDDMKKILGNIVLPQKSS